MRGPRAAALQRRRGAPAGARPRKDDAVFYRNAQGDEVVFVVEGAGVLESSFGELAYRAGDYVVIPRGILHRWRLGTAPQRLLVIESARLRAHAEALPQRARPAHSRWRPYCERDIRRPERLVPHDETGDVPAARQERQRADRAGARRTTRSTSSAGTATTIRGRFSIHDFEPRRRAACTCRRRCTRRSRATASSSARSCRGRSTSIRTRCRRPTTTRTSMSRRGALLRERRVHEPQGHRARLDHAAPGRPAARAAARAASRSRSAPSGRTSSR